MSKKELNQKVLLSVDAVAEACRCAGVNEWMMVLMVMVLMVFLIDIFFSYPSSLGYFVLLFIKSPSPSLCCHPLIRTQSETSATEDPGPLLPSGDCDPSLRQKSSNGEKKGK